MKENEMNQHSKNELDILITLSEVLHKDEHFTFKQLGNLRKESHILKCLCCGSVFRFEYEEKINAIYQGYERYIRIECPKEQCSNHDEMRYIPFTFDVVGRVSREKTVA